MSLQNSQMLAERRYARPLAGLILVLIWSGYLSWGWPAFSVFQQWLWLLHTFLGLALSAALLPYLFLHFRRTIGLKRSWVAFSGILAALLVVALVVTGLHVVLFGQSEAERWVFQSHVWLSAVAVAILVGHVAFHALSLPERRKNKEPSRFPSLAGSSAKGLVTITVIGFLFVAGATFAYQFRTSPYSDTPAIEPYGYSYGEHPFRPSQTETSTGGFFDVKRVGGSERCASCHLEIAEQWQASIHAQAASDKTYQTNIKLLSERKGMDATRYCEGCHAPVALLSGQLTKGGKLDTPGHMQQGVSCMACHGIERIEHLKGVASYRFAPPQAYLFDGADRSLPVFLHNFLIRLKPEQHKADLAKSVLAAPEICATCHAQFMDKDFNNWGWVKMQDDYTAWLNGPYSGQTRQTFAHAQQRRCQDCHFPLQPGKDPSASPEGLIKTHFNVGANTAVPWVTRNEGQLERTRRFLTADQVRISIDKPNRNDAVETARHVDPSLIPSTEAPAYCYLGEKVTLKVAVTNAQVGHAFPGGTTDINEVWIHFLVKDGQGRTVYESGQLDAGNNVEPNAYFYRSIPIDRQGNAVWRHDLFNMVGDSFKRTIPPGGSDVTSYTFTISDDTKGPLTVTAGINYRKLNNRYARWAFKDDRLELPIVEMAATSLTLPVKIRPQVANAAYDQ
ncbi:cytochrome c family protein [Methylomonas sp. HW2-6]|uniref:cytochrome c family protein n=1 Tax=Methylomonas sp. HW2-6 TaxID=3376687 RepID=UPI00404179FE